MRLAELQEAMQAAILEDDIGAFPPCRETATFDRLMRFRVYSDAYRLRLASFLAGAYPALREALGDAAFGALIEAFIGAHPSRVPTAQAYTPHLPGFLVTTTPWCDDRAALDLTRFECALGRAFDAADSVSLGLERLAEMAPERWPRLVVTFHASVELLVLAAGTVAAYERLEHFPANRTPVRGAKMRQNRDVELLSDAMEMERALDHDDLGPNRSNSISTFRAIDIDFMSVIDSESSERDAGGESAGRPRAGAEVAEENVSLEAVLVWRGEGGVFYRRLEAAEYRAFDAARRGRCFAEICESLAEAGRDEEAVTQDVATCLARWFTDGIIIAAS